MGQTSDELKDQIGRQREHLGENLTQLEQQVRNTVDWRAQFEQHPMTGVGVAFAAGFAIAALMGGGSSDDRDDRSASPATNYRISDGNEGWPSVGANVRERKRPSPEMKEINETIEGVRGALMGMAATKLRSYLADSVPGFAEEYEQARDKRHFSEASRIEKTDSEGNGQTSSTWPSHATMTGAETNASGPSAVRP